MSYPSSYGSYSSPHGAHGHGEPSEFLSATLLGLGLMVVTTVWWWYVMR
jgi:hypothetical protein